jgi:hypothetical protein
LVVLIILPLGLFTLVILSVSVVGTEILLVVASAGAVATLPRLMQLQHLLKNYCLLPILLNWTLNYFVVTAMILSFSERYRTKSWKLIRLPENCFFLFCRLNIWNIE